MIDQQPQTIGESLNEYLQASGLARAAEASAVFSAWRDSVTDEIARHTRVLGLRNNVLAVEVDSAALLQELSTFYRSQILEALKRKLSRSFICDVRFLLGNFP